MIRRMVARLATALLLMLGVSPVSVAAPVAPVQGFDDCGGRSWCPQMVIVPAGSFVMGSPASEAGRQIVEGPQRTIVVPAFAVSRFEVTFDQWDACVHDGGCDGHRPGDQHWGRGANPVFNVSWKDAQAYTSWLSRKTGRSYRLLSEAEWEYAARAGTTTPFSTGQSIDARAAQFQSQRPSYIALSRKDLGRVRPVGSFPPNRFGLYDMQGNVAEWVQDCWVGGYGAIPTSAAPVSVDQCSRYVVRGGAWADPSSRIRTAQRGRNYLWMRLNVTGFRVARSVRAAKLTLQATN